MLSVQDLLRTGGTLLPFVVFHAIAFGDDSPVLFARDIQPILAANCLNCHGPDDSAREAGLRLDERASALATLDSGSTAIIEGDPEHSELILRIETDDEILRMPPPETGKQLTEEEIELLRRWVMQGANYSSHWAFTPIKDPQLPTVRDDGWIRNGIDRFVLSRLEAADISPSPQASRVRLIRRLFLDLLGLPPSEEDVREFLTDSRPDAYERVVDRLLESPHFGERWGQHWLDLARYADSDGYAGDKLRPNAYRYRDWVIAAINSDLSFDQFTIQQIAGDLLPGAGVDEKTATGFHRNVMRNGEAGVDREADRVIQTVDRLNTVGAVWLGLTIGCAEFHSHKFDPISHQEYYQLYAFFNSLSDFDLPVEGQTDSDDDSSSVYVPTIGERKSPRTTFVHIRGDFRRPGEKVAPQTPAFLPPMEIRGQLADRLDFACWLVRDDHPLTARVVVNRFWKCLFGEGIVDSEDNFGTSGSLPSHPELLDWLACRFRESGWSRKAIVRLMVTSATYRQDSTFNPVLQQLDPQNRWLARQNRFRLEAETVRDLALSAGGLLSPHIGGPGICPPRSDSHTPQAGHKLWAPTQGEAAYRRGMYILRKRTLPYPSLSVFDLPDASSPCVDRDRSNSPLQALTLLNDPVFFESARSLGRDLARMGSVSDEVWIKAAVWRTLSRPAEPEELSELKIFSDQFGTLLQSASTDDLRHIIGAEEAELEPVEHAKRVLMARCLMNLDEFFTRE